MAFSIVKMLGLGKKSPDIKPITTPLPPVSLTGTPVGADVNEAIRNAIAQGFGSEFVSRATSPVAAQRRADFETFERPGLESSLSARGLGRSTIGARDIGRAEAQVGRDINQIIAEATVQNQLAKERARAQGLSFAGQEAALQTGRAVEETRRAERQQGLGIGAEQARAAQDRQTLNQIIASAAAVASGQPGKIADIFGGTGGAQTSDLATLSQFLKSSGGGTPSAFTGGGGLDVFTGRKRGTQGGTTLASLAPGQPGGFGSQFGNF